MKPKKKRHDARRALMLAAALLSLCHSGCVVGSVYAYKANTAAASLKQAKTLGAEKYAEYDYYFARENLQKAMEEAAEASYGDAILFADIAEEYAQKAIAKAGATHRGAGR